MKTIIINNPLHHTAPLEMHPQEFRVTGINLINQIANFLEELPHKPVTTGEHPSAIRSFLGNNSMPEEGTEVNALIEDASKLLFDHSLFNGHPRFWGYITSSAAPIGALADLLSAAVNPNVGAFTLSPMATEIELQTIQWIAEFIGYPADSSGLFVSGGNMANFIGFLAARKSKADWDIRKEGLHHQNKRINKPWGYYNPKIEKKDDVIRKMTLYCSKGTHTWIQKAADLFGLGTNGIRWIDVNKDQQINIESLEWQIIQDIKAGYAPLMVVGNAGSVSTGIVDPLSEIASICKKYNLWFHIDGAFGAPAAVLPELSSMFSGLSEADSIALDPHKWLYSPLEAGCILVRHQHHLTDAFSFHPEYYNFNGNEDDPATNFYDLGLQNSRGFRALKVWLGLKQSGKEGYIRMIRQNIELAQNLYNILDKESELQAISHSLSITTFRYLPAGLDLNAAEVEAYLNKLNETLLNQLQSGGEIFLSNAVIDGMYCLRICIVNFRTSLDDIKAIPDIVLRYGKIIDNELRPVYFE
ncbi:aspartate aminotransferase family protein [soil metagenome]